MSTATEIKALDLRKEYPRSPNDSLGGYVILPRTIDKARADFAGMAGEYVWDCPLGGYFFSFTNIKPADFGEFVKQGKTDEEILAWVNEVATSHTEDEILAWSYDCRNYQPQETASKAFFERKRAEKLPGNYKVNTFFQLLDTEEGRL